MQQQSYQARKQALEADCLKSLEESKRTLAETNEVSQQTAAELARQTEQLEGIHSKTEDINHNLDTSQGLLNGMKSWWGSFKGMFSKDDDKQKGKGGKEKEGKIGGGKPGEKERERSESHKGYGTAAVSGSSRALAASRAAGGGDGGARGAAASSSSNARGPATSTVQKSDFDQQMDSHLDDIDGMLGELHGRAMEMNSQIKYQGEVLKEVTDNVENANARIADQRQQMKKLMKR
uniref:t-SNARE coiled-coil homology domain-containing protein n=1 Tax=Chromera velia CCMP2878 TaxID=1169474 RepID=A0A0G4HL74_9ALVE|eukprot:Cvel_7392.t1-p1 / transcript=Cvel_7392.t1 / gene=Cvel_7392 / organism=Chromera_velia_CCMP2878 / gene_product=hypothetical protein / transcript_product=hypothetical protein / location=Cvel_scaffold385:36443-40708(-) / protein_length=234 / sequence_SO=supercontig / SO=protein_coding / is_pseudo=false